MKRFIPVLVVVLTLSSLGIWVTGAYADTLTRPVAAVGGSGMSGSMTLTGSTSTTGVASTHITITLSSADSNAFSVPRAAAVYKGVCGGLQIPAVWTLNSVSASGVGGTGISDTPAVPQSLSTLAGSSPYYAVAITDATSGVVLACGDVGMPSVTSPMTIIIQATNVLSPVTQPSFVVESLFAQTKQLKVAIFLSGEIPGMRGELTGLTFSAFVRKGTCAALDRGAPLYKLNDVVNGQSTTLLALDDFLPDGLAITAEKPNSAVGEYLACTNITSDQNQKVSGQPIVATPGMPKTGNANSGYAILPLALGTLGLIMFVLGLRLTRRNQGGSSRIKYLDLKL